MTPSSPAGSPPTPDTTPSLADVLRYLAGAAQLMAGNKAGLTKLDLSADGFWGSFFSIAVALPALALSWIAYETAEPADVPKVGTALAYGAHAFADIAGWLLPILVLMAIAKWIGFSRKIVPLVVATNWGGALVTWAAVPYWLLILAFGQSELVLALGLGISLASIALMVRLTATSIGGDVATAIGIVLLMIVTSLVTYGAVMDVTGVTLI